MKSDWQQFKILNLNKLSSAEKETILSLFKRLEDVEFPSILEQYEGRFWARVELDRTILKILGFSNKMIDEWLPKIYDVLIKELKGE